MPTTSKSTQHEQCNIENNPTQEESNIDESSSDQEQKIEQEVTFNPSQAFPTMFMPYMEDPKMDWTVNDGLCSRSLKWKLKCESILEYELAMPAEKENAKQGLPGVRTLG